MFFPQKKSNRLTPHWKQSEYNNPKWRPVIAVDFDGVLHDYSFDRDGLRIGSVTGPQIYGAMDWLTKLYIDDQVDVAIHSFRSRSLFGQLAMRRWMLNRLIETLPAHFNDPRGKFMGDPLYEGVYSWIRWPWFKPYASVYLDDKAWCFKGTWPEVEALTKFKAWNK